MEEADKLILDTLRSLQCDVELEKTDLGQLTTEQIVEGVVLCIHAIDTSSQSRLKTKLPPGMSARFNFGTKLADECRGLGCPGDLGYQTFLYASDKEVRNILIFLIEKLPRQEESISAGPESYLTRLKRSVADKVEKDLKSEETNKAKIRSNEECEPFCSCVICYPPEQSPNIFDSLPRETRNSAFGNTKSRAHKFSLLPSIIDTHAILKTKLDTENAQNQQKETKNHMIKVLKHEFSEAKESEEIKKKELLDNIEKPLMDTYYFTKAQDEKVEDEGKVSEAPKSTAENEMKTKKLLIEQKQEIEKVIENKTAVYKDLRSSLINQNKEIAELQLRKKTVEETLLKADEEMEKHQKILKLLPDGEENLNKLINIVQKSKDRLEGLKEQWKNHKHPMEEEYLQTVESIEKMKVLSEQGQKKQPSILEKFDKVKADIKAKEEQYQKLIKSSQSITEGETRDSYTKRILDILNQIEKLRDGIDSVIADVKTIQKDINMLNGKLERSYFEISMTMKSKMNNKEPYIEQSMRINSQIHQACFNTVETIRRTGAVSRETRDIMEQVKAEESKGLQEKSMQLAEDLQALQRENKELAKQYKKAIA